MSGEHARNWAINLKQVAVIGAGTMGEGIAQNFAEAGLTVRLIDVASEALERCKTQVAANIALAVECGVTADDGGSAVDRIQTIQTGNCAEAADGCDVVVETVSEMAELKREVFAKLDRLPADVLLASNSSSMTMTSICGQMNTPERAVGLHYFNPAHIIPAVELHHNVRTTEESIARARALLERCGKTVVLVRKESPGFVLNRLTGALYREIAHLLDQGVVTPEELDEGVRASLGFRLAWVGPLRGEDFIGLDTSLRVSREIFPKLTNRTEPEQGLVERVERGDLGVKTGRGWYDYRQTTRADLLKERNIQLLLQLKAYKEAGKL